MPECNNCETFVTPRFVRVFGDNQNDLYGCHNCLSSKELTAGRASAADA